MERYWREWKDLHLVFNHSEKARDRVLREVLWKVLKKKGFCIAFFLYDGG